MLYETLGGRISTDYDCIGRQRHSFDKYMCAYNLPPLNQGPLDLPKIPDISAASNPKLTIRDLPASGVQLHIHEGQGGSSHLKTYKGEYINLDSYRSAMLDHLLEKGGYKQIKK